MVEAANSAAGRTRGTYAHTRAFKRRRGHQKAIVAVAGSILVSAYYILRDGMPYDELGGDYFLNRERAERLTAPRSASSSASASTLRSNP